MQIFNTNIVNSLGQVSFVHYIGSQIKQHVEGQNMGIIDLPVCVMATRCTLTESVFGMADMCTIGLKFDLSMVLGKPKLNAV